MSASGPSGPLVLNIMDTFPFLYKIFFYLRRFSESRSGSSGTKCVQSVIPKLFIPFIQTLPNDCSHIEDVHLLFCACFIFFPFLRGVELGHFFFIQNA